jgi:hypothetical protein
MLTTVSPLSPGHSYVLTMPATSLLRRSLLPPLYPASAGLQVTKECRVSGAAPIRDYTARKL